MSIAENMMPLAIDQPVRESGLSRSPLATSVPAVSCNLSGKRALDRLLASILLVPALPLIGLLMLLVRATSRGRD